MASDQQVVALARVQRGGSSHLNRAARQVIPAFLQKLYEMVNDAANSSLIRWSDAGDSFFVLDHERFAREVLGRWFKHQNFSSFVRQLNMYGFHKIPHLQQGVLKSDSETEFWHFEHPNFHRGQPDLLCLIQRKKQMAQVGDEHTSALDIRDHNTMPRIAAIPSSTTPATTATAAATTAALSPGQILDINSIVNGIAVIKRHQTTISTDLNELKSSNEHLWQEALASRERHKKHQDTINRILKFLAGVFGDGGNAAHKSGAVNHQPVAQRTPQRLMIEHNPSRQGKGVGIVEIEDEEMGHPLPSSILEDPPSVSSISPFSPSAMPSSTTPSVPPTPFEAPQTENAPAPLVNATQADAPPSESSPTTASPNQDAMVQADAPPSDSSLTTTTPNQDAMVQAALAEMLNSPAQLQRLLAAFSTQQGYQIPDQLPPPGAIDQQLDQAPSLAPSQSQLTSYDPQFDFSRALHADPAFPFSIPDFSSTTSSTIPDAITAYDPLADQVNRVHRTYKDKEEIDKDVNVLSNSINSLIETFGLDPSIVNPPQSTSTPLDPLLTPSSADPTAPAMDATAGEDADFDFDAFINGFTSAADTNGHDLADQMDSSAFLDEVPSPSDRSSSPISLRHHSPVNSTTTATAAPTTSTTRDRKRKSDVAQLDNSKSSTMFDSEAKARKKR